MNGLVLRAAERTVEDAQAFCSLSNALYARKVDPAYYDWQFHACPHAPQLFTAWAGAEMVGAYGVHVCPADATGGARAMMLDIMVRQDRQGEGLVRPLGELAHAYAEARGARTLCVVANARALRAHARHFAWRAWRDLTEWVRPAGTGGGPHAAGDAGPDWAAVEACAARGFYPRDRRTLSWRIGESPRYRYHWARAGRAAAQAVCKGFTDPVTGETSTDLLAVFPEPGGTFEDALESLAATRAIDAGSRTIAVPMDAAQEAALSRAGFSPSARVRHVCGAGEPPQGHGWGMLDVDVY